MRVVHVHCPELPNDPHFAIAQDSPEITDPFLEDGVHLGDRFSQVRARGGTEIAVTAGKTLKNLRHGEAALVGLHPLSDDADPVEIALVGILQIGKQF